MCRDYRAPRLGLNRRFRNPRANPPTHDLRIPIRRISLHLRVQMVCCYTLPGKPFMRWEREAVGTVVTQTPKDSARSTDQSVVRRIVEGDRAALAELYDRYSTAVFSLACRIVGSADAEDVTQEVFTQAWKQAARYDEARASAVAWLLNMTRTRAIDRLRANRTRLKFAGDPARIDLMTDGGADA